VIEQIRPETRQVDVGEPIVVIIPGGDAHTPPSLPGFQTGSGRHIFKGTITFIAIKHWTRVVALLKSFKSGSLDKQNVHPAIIVKVESGRARALGFE
jgi:hypothetical protein